MKILYISSSPSEKQFEYIESMVNKDSQNSNYGMPEASYKFHKLIMEGLQENGAQITSVVGRSVSKKTHKGLIWKKKKENKNTISYNHVFFINLPIIKQLLICLQVLFIGLFWLFKNRKEKNKFIIIDGAYVTLIPIVNFLSLFSNINKISIIGDVYSYMADVSDARSKKNPIHKIINKIIKNQYQKIDGFIFLTEEMSNLLPFKNKPYSVIEGIVDSACDQKEKADNYIMYAGALRAEYGVKRLVEAFHNVQNKDFKLLLFGNGNFVDEIIKISKEDSRIMYMGKKNLKEVYEYEKNAFLLVNPRYTNDEFVKYSFPSKNMEYMLSGTPLLTGKLPGMPKEYDDYVYLIEEDTTESLTKSLSEIFMKRKKDIKDFGGKAQKFILKQKNKKVQSKKIIELNHKIEKDKEKEKLTPIFKFVGINKYLPIIFAGGFFLATILLFMFGPYEWYLLNGVKTYSFLILAFLLLVLGYMVAVYKPTTYSQKKQIDINKLFFYCLVIFFIIYFPTVYIRTGKLFPNIINGIMNSGQAYRLSHASNGSIIEYIRIFVSPFLGIITPLYILFFNKLNNTNRILGGISIILNLFLGIASGVSKQFADFVIQVCIVCGLLFFSNDNAKKIKSKLLLIVIVVLTCCSFLVYYKAIMTNRVSTDIQTNLNNQGESVEEPDNNIVEETMVDYSSFGFATIKEKHLINKVLPENLKSPTLFLISYLTHGYKGLSLAMDKDFTTSFGLGFSEFLRHNFSRFGSKNFEQNIYERTYMYKIEENGWKTLDVWSSFFIYPASDIGFIFTLVLTLFIGFLFGYAWKDVLITGNVVAAGVFYNLLIMIFYFSANNQLFQTGENFVYSTLLLVVYFIQIIYKKRRG